MNPKSPKFKRARAVIEVDAVPIHARWMPVEAAVNSVLAKFGIKTKITLRQETHFLIVEGSRRQTPKLAPRVNERPMYRQVLPVEKIKKGDFYQAVTGGIVTLVSQGNDWIGKTPNDLKVGGTFYREVEN